MKIVEVAKIERQRNMTIANFHRRSRHIEAINVILDYALERGDIFLFRSKQVEIHLSKSKRALLIPENPN